MDATTTWLGEGTRGLLDAMFRDDPSLRAEDVVSALTQAREAWQGVRDGKSDAGWREVVFAAIGEVSRQAAGEAVGRYVENTPDFDASQILVDLERNSNLDDLYVEYARYTNAVRAPQSPAADPLHYRTGAVVHSFEKLRPDPLFAHLTDEQLMADIAKGFDDHHSR